MGTDCFTTRTSEKRKLSRFYYDTLIYKMTLDALSAQEAYGEGVVPATREQFDASAV